MPQPASVRIPLALARQHPRFGLRRGELLALGCLLVAGLLRSIGNAVRDWGDADPLAPSALDRMADTVTVGLILLEAAFVVAWFCRWRHCRPAWLGLTLLEVASVVGMLLPAVLAARADGVAAGALAHALLPVGIGVLVGTCVRLLFWWFMGRSAAYRVTFEQLVAADDPILQAPAAPAAA